MAYDEGAAARVRAVLAGRGGVEEKVVMGGLAFMVDGSMCCSVGADGVLFRVAKADRERLLELPHVTPMELGPTDDARLRTRRARGPARRERAARVDRAGYRGGSGRAAPEALSPSSAS